MKCLEVFQSIQAWQKLAGILMKPAIAFKIMRYMKLVGTEHEIIEKQRVALAYEISGVPKDQNVELKPGSPELAEFQERFGEVLSVESTLPLIELDFDTVLEALDDKECTVTVSDLAALEPFFTPEEIIDAEVIDAEVAA